GREQRLDDHGLASPPIVPGRPEYLYGRRNPAMWHGAGSLSGVTEQAIHSAVGAGELCIEGPKKLCEPLQARRTQHVDLDPKCVLLLVTRTTALESNPLKPTKLFQHRPQRAIGLADNIGIGHGLRIARRRRGGARGARRSSNFT